jgi:hypothetical protein
MLHSSLEHLQYQYAKITISRRAVLDTITRTSLLIVEDASSPEHRVYIKKPFLSKEKLALLDKTI